MRYNKINIIEYPDKHVEIELVTKGFNSPAQATSFLVSIYSRLPKTLQEMVDKLLCDKFYLTECLDNLHQEYEKSQTN